MSEINLRSISSEHFTSFMVCTEDGDYIGCHMPRFDAQSFVSKAQELINTKEHFPEVDFETQNAIVETMGAGLSVMFQFTNKSNGKSIQFALESGVCQDLLEKMQKSMNTATKRYGEAMPIKNKWEFLCGQEEKEGVLRKIR